MLMTGCNADKSVLKVYNWGDYIDEAVLDMFTEETGIRVDYSTFASNEEMYAKLKSGAGDYDVIFPSDYMIERMSKEGLLAPIDTAGLENYPYIGDDFKNMEFDPKNQYSVPYMWGTVGILYNTSMVDDPVNSWNILWDEKYSGQIMMYNSSRDSMMVALSRLGYDINTRNEAQIEEAIQSLIEQKPHVLAYVEDEVGDKMIAGEGAFAVVYSGEAVLAMGGNEDLDYVIPQEGSNIWVDSMAIPESSSMKDEAVRFINFLCRPDVALINLEYIGYSSPNTEAMANIDPALLDNPAFNPPQEWLDTCTVYYDLGEFKAVYDDAWTRIKAE